MCHQETAVRVTGVAQGHEEEAPGAEEPARLGHTHEHCPYRLLVEFFAVRGHLPTHRSREGGCNFYPELRLALAAVKGAGKQLSALLRGRESGELGVVLN